MIKLKGNKLNLNMRKLSTLLILVLLSCCTPTDQYNYTHQYEIKVFYRNGDNEIIKTSYTSRYRDCDLRISTTGKTTTYLSNCEWDNLNIFDVRRFEIIKHDINKTKIE